MPTLQTYDDYLEDVLSLDMAQEAVADRSLNSNMFDFLVKEEPLGEDDLRALQKDRQKKDNHNMSKLIMLCHILNIDLESQSINCVWSWIAKVFADFAHFC